jgi:hypothetical protein
MSCRATAIGCGMSAALAESAAREGRVPPRPLVLGTPPPVGDGLADVRERVPLPGCGRVEFHLDRWFCAHRASGRRPCGRAGARPSPTSPDGAIETVLHALWLRWEDLFEDAVAVRPDGLGVADEREVVLHDRRDERFRLGGRSHVNIVENFRRFARFQLKQP